MIVDVEAYSLFTDDFLNIFMSDELNGKKLVGLKLRKYQYVVFNHFSFSFSHSDL